METRLIETGTFPVGIEVGGKYFQSYRLEEEKLAHKLAVFTDPALGRDALLNPAIQAAALLARRLHVDGLFDARFAAEADFKERVKEYARERKMKPAEVTAADIHPVTVDMVNELCADDGNEISVAASLLVQRRADFRSKAGSKKSAGDGDGTD